MIPPNANDIGDACPMITNIDKTLTQHDRRLGGVGRLDGLTGQVGGVLELVRGPAH